jgi:CDP-6-deoxy-D-xylo-4-hexulose-3-dehydrase
MTKGPKLYPLATTTFTNEELEAAKAVLDSQRLTMGEQVQAFQNEFAAWTGAKHALMVNSGSSANLLMVDALLRRTGVTPPLQPGDEVLVPALAWPTTVWPVLQLGLVPVFVDVDLKTLAIDLESARSVVTAKTKAVFLIHVLGQTPKMDEFLAFCKEKNLLLMEDVCESLGSYFGEKQAGNFGVMGSFSCYFSHHISTIEGGVVVTSDTKLYDDLLSMRAHGWIRDRSDEAEWKSKFPAIDPRFMFILPGYNVRPMEIQAAIGRVQLKKLDGMLAARETLAKATFGFTKRYTPWLRLIGSENLPRDGSSDRRKMRRHSWMTLPFLLQKDAPLSLRDVKDRLEAAGVETRPIIAGNLLHHPALVSKNAKKAQSLSNSDHVLAAGFMIGCHPLNIDKSLGILEQAFKSLAQHG